VTASGLALALDWRPGTGFRAAALPVPTQGKTGFSLVALQQTGVWFSNFLSQEALVENPIPKEGSGVALGDVDGDGWGDLYCCCQQWPNRLDRNLGQWKFQGVTEGAGATCADPAFDRLCFSRRGWGR